MQKYTNLCIGILRNKNGTKMTIVGVCVCLCTKETMRISEKSFLW